MPISRRPSHRASPRPVQPPRPDGRVPPHDLDAEGAVLSAILLNATDTLPHVRREVRPEHFYSDANRRILEAVFAVSGGGKPIDIVTVAAELRANGALDAVGGSPYLVQLVDQTPHVGNVTAHARIVAEKAALREIIATCQRLAAEGYVVDDVRSFIDHARETLRPRLASHGEREAASIVEIGESACKLILDRAHGTEAPIPTKWDAFNRSMRGGFWPGFHSLVSTTGMGKTQWVLDVATHAAKYEAVRARKAAQRPHPVRVYGLELSKIEMWTRAASLLLGVAWSDFLYGTLGGRETAELLNLARDKMDALPLDFRAPSPLEFDYRTIDAIRYEHEAERPCMVIIDYMQLVNAPEDIVEDARRIMGKTAVAGREIARSCNIPVIGVSSTARVSYGLLDGTGPSGSDKLELGTGSARRLVAVAKESGDVEYASDSVLVLCRKDSDEPPSRANPADAWLGIAKARFGGGGWVKLSWTGTEYKDWTDASGYQPIGTGNTRGKR